MKVFISYAREDIETARKLRDDLEKAGIKTWLDKVDLLPGQDWKAVIRKEIKESDYFIALLSSNSLSKCGHVQKELKTALDALGEFPKGDIFIVPVRLDACEPQDEELQNLHWAELFPSYKKGLNDILRALGISRPPSPPVKIQRWMIAVVSLLVIAGAMYPIIRSDAFGKLIKIFQKSEAGTEKMSEQTPKYQLRKTPIVASDEEALKIFKLKKDSDSKRRPIEYIEHNFKDNGDGTISDHATGLMWQKSGSDNRLQYDKARAYIEELNSKKIAGYNDWRLPTVDELKSLLTPDKQSGNLYISLIFNENQRLCWASDKYASEGAWLVGFDYGFVGWNYLYAIFWVRAVRSIQ